MKKLRLVNFKCFIDNEISFRKCTILAGNNAAGKSSVIQALLLYDSSVNNTGMEYLKLKDALHIGVGGPKRLVSQHANKSDGMDFGVAVDGAMLYANIDRENPGLMHTSARAELKITPLTYVSAERLGPRTDYTAEGADDIDVHGNNFAYVMECADLAGLQIPDSLVVDKKLLKFSYQVECWLNLIMDSQLQISNFVNIDSARAEIKYKNEFTDQPVVPTLTGFGISYCMPIIVAGLWCAAKGNRMLIIENPEAHLHPYAQSMIGKFLAMVAEAGVQVIIETHSEHVVDGARIQMYCMQAQEDFLANFLSKNGDKIDIKELYIEEDGELSDWPKGFFDQKQIDLRQLFTMRMENGSNQ